MRSLSWCFCAREARTRVFSISRCYERAPALLRTCELTYFSSYFPFLSCRRVALLPIYPILLLSQLCVLPISLSSTHAHTRTLTHAHTHTRTHAHMHQHSLFVFSARWLECKWLWDVFLIILLSSGRVQEHDGTVTPLLWCNKRKLFQNSF